VISAVTLLALAGSARAQQPAPTTNLVDTGHWTVTPFVGVGFSGDLDSATGAIGVAGGYIWSSRVSLEGEFNFLPSSEASGFVELDSKEWSLTGNVLYHFAGRAFVPYGVLGIGFGHGSVDLNTNDPRFDVLDTSSTEFVVNFGGGVERRIRERLAFRGDLRYFFGGDFVPDYWRAIIGLTFDLGRR
jgi:opacity protein-like surface antigen